MNEETLDWSQLHHKDPQGRVFGPRFINLYATDLELKTCQIKQYANDTVLLTSDCDLDICTNSLEHSIEVILE